MLFVSIRCMAFFYLWGIVMDKHISVMHLVESAEMIEFAVRGGAPSPLIISKLDDLQDDIASLLQHEGFEPLEASLSAVNRSLQDDA